MAMLPFCGYHMADYWRHWIAMGERGGEKMPRDLPRQLVSQRCRRPLALAGFRREHAACSSGWWPECMARSTRSKRRRALVPRPNRSDLSEIGITGAAAEELLGVDRDAWMAEADTRDRFFQRFGDSLPAGDLF